ncbi:pentatricopeptide repeat-containing protein 2, mitochondrial-like isoform X2 [Battus philenor]|uniref:pentatricopeptide repeat-containing protein 2, mitochondrial-like isoform X2 n=1 Tax=Battus philenor TaxID=42288 RepID=UPI0035CFA8E9
MFVNSVKSLKLCDSRFMVTRFFHVTQDGYLQSRKRIKEQFSHLTDNFKTKMKDFVNESKNMIFTEDLKNMVHLAECTDLHLVLNMITKFNDQNTKLRFDSFVFGPVVMRMFYFLDTPNEALQCFEDPANNGFFDQLISYQILLNLLYNNKMYEEMYRVFETIQQKRLNMSKYPKYSVNLILAACYKQNTPESMEYASKVWSDMIKVGVVPVRRASALFAALALNQGAPHLALESISMQKPHYVTIRNIKAIALAEVGRVEDALSVLRGVLEIDSPEQNNKHTFFEETISKVHCAVEKADSKDIQKEFQNLERALRDRELIDNKTLDQLVTSEIKNSSNSPVKPRGMPQLPYGLRQRKKVSLERAA